MGINVLSLFDGMSCGQIALARAGIKVDNYFASEIDKYAIQVTQNNYPKTIQLGEVTRLDIKKLPDIDLLIGGSPCQGFSFAGKQLAFDDPRSKLFFVYVDILNRIKSVNQDIKFMLENVRMKQEYLNIISEQLGVTPVLINSSLVSAQNRQRYYWANIPNITQPEDKDVQLVDILEDVGTGWVKIHGECHSRYKKAMCLDANYFKEVDNHGQHTIIKCGQMVGRKINPANGKRDDYNKDVKVIQRIELRDGGKTGTLTTIQKDNLVVSNNKYRKLTPVECERLQTVPDNYTEGVSNTQRYKMLGNGWTVSVISHIFKALLRK